MEEGDSAGDCIGKTYDEALTFRIRFPAGLVVNRAGVGHIPQGC